MPGENKLGNLATGAGLCSGTETEVDSRYSGALPPKLVTAKMSSTQSPTWTHATIQGLRSVWARTDFIMNGCCRSFAQYKADDAQPDAHFVRFVRRLLLDHEP